MWPLMTFEVILQFMKKLRLLNVSIHRNVDQNRFINECARKKKAKSYRVSHFFLWDAEELMLLINSY